MFLMHSATGLCGSKRLRRVTSFCARTSRSRLVSFPVPHTFHIVHADADQHATMLELVARSPVRVNAGFFVLRRQIFEYMKPGEDLVIEPFERLIAERQLLAIPHEGFWRNMDTFKDKMQLDDMVARGQVPWQVWAQR